MVFSAHFFPVVVGMVYTQEIRAIVEAAFDSDLFDEEFVFIFGDFTVDPQGYVSTIYYEAKT